MTEAARRCPENAAGPGAAEGVLAAVTRLIADQDGTLRRIAGRPASSRAVRELVRQQIHTAHLAAEIRDLIRSGYCAGALAPPPEPPAAVRYLRPVS